MADLESPRFPDCIAYGSQGGPGYSTDVVVFKSGKEQRNQNWELPRHKFDVNFGTHEQEDLEDLSDFFNQLKGAFTAFRFRNFLDFRSGHTGEDPAFNDQVIGTGNGVATQFQLKKTYASGAYNNIVKPTLGSVLIGVNGVQLMSGFSVDHTTGIVTITPAPANGHVVTAGFTYDLRCRFESDDLVMVLESFLLGSATMRIVEVK